MALLKWVSTVFTIRDMTTPNQSGKGSSFISGNTRMESGGLHELSATTTMLLPSELPCVTHTPLLRVPHTPADESVHFPQTVLTAIIFLINRQISLRTG